MEKVYRGVDGYNIDEEYNKIMLESEKSRQTAAIRDAGSYIDVFRGSNLVRCKRVDFSLPCFLPPTNNHLCREW